MSLVFGQDFWNRTELILGNPHWHACCDCLSITIRCFWCRVKHPPTASDIDIRGLKGSRRQRIAHSAGITGILRGERNVVRGSGISMKTLRLGRAGAKPRRRFLKGMFRRLLFLCIVSVLGLDVPVLDVPGTCIHPPAAGLAGGDRVTITGPGFGLGMVFGSSVHIGATYCDAYSWISDTSVSCLLQEGGGANDRTSALRVELE